MRFKIIFSLFVVLLAINSFAQVNPLYISPGSEIGDAVFRPLWINTPEWMINAGHAAIYFCSKGLYEWETGEDLIDSDGLHSVIQATGQGYEVGPLPFSFFLEGYTQWGLSLIHI